MQKKSNQHKHKKVTQKLQTPVRMGIDNNPTGAIAIVEFPLGRKHNVLELMKMPTYSVGKNIYIDEGVLYSLLCQYNASHENVIVGFEIGQRQPLFGTKGNFANGYSYGVLKTVARISGIRNIEVNPKTWQKVIHKDIRGADMSTKEASIEYCRRMFPEQTLLASKRCTKKDDGMADALCIASYINRI